MAMVNEALFFITAIVDLLFVLAMLKFGRMGPVVAIVVNIILISTFGAKLTSVFGFVTNVGNAFYASIFFAGALLVEHFGKREAYKSVWIGAIALTVFIVMGQLTIHLGMAPETHAIADALQAIFQRSVRIALASLAAYILSQHLNIWLFDYLCHRKTMNAPWIRIMAGASAGQFLDSVIFFSIAFIGAVSASVLVEAIVVGFVLKVAVAALSVPFMYRSMKFKTRWVALGHRCEHGVLSFE